MQQYLDLCKYILSNGEDRDDRTGTGTRSVFGYQTRYDLRDGFPLMTTKKMFLRPIAEELLWFLKGDTNIKYLVDRNVRIWNEWPYENFKKSDEYHGETLEEFVELIKNHDADSEFVKVHGALGPVYGAQWRDFNGEGVDQIQELVDGLINNPFSRRHIVCAWNPAKIDKMALPPCHAFLQFYVSADKKYLSCQLYQRSADVFLGVPFNIASYALMTAMLAQVCGYEAKEFVHTIGDAHIYKDHFDVVNEQLTRVPLPKCKLSLNPEVKNIFDFTIDDIKIENYESYGKLVGKVSV
ncbi:MULTISPECIES: thymidylate synthase [unclassified Breznakia]|uniref:thymidylate synthase n=1 Tax=unclassified Breznakia TaxID=2623764 RepID=UPI00247300B6|nr:MULTISPECIES: thymidylate synthase [unclassified Breznakia]MDH6366327.1 thymidylate synthase [Breznakia sp. PH1-1]MDH6403420.1 thymidylate synthase [Breznakia sp. PF1-11]MDH6411129.1 thymidylate synthase [Breznakia sp. PFB1-11]MDH6413608.1 thymidylate synthase [Breznakia sp. PFB1-14]MDH6415674.1 thymidylate synthase [Breznakia sp. PFB1-4]